MARRYVKFNMPIKADERLKTIQMKTIQTVKDYTGKDIRIPKTRIIMKILERPIWFSNREVLEMSKRRFKP